MSFTSINYEEPQPETYKSVEIFDVNDKKTLFESGDFVKDWYDRIKFLIYELENEPFHMGSSSIDHFIMDGAPFDSAYLKLDKDENPYLDYEFDYENRGTEFFVEKGTTPTWEELREICKDKKLKI